MVATYSLKRSVVVHRIDHDRWQTEFGVVRVPDAPLVLHGVRYEFLVDEDTGVARVVGHEKLPWSDRLRRVMVGPSCQLSLDQVLTHPSVLSSKKENIRQWMDVPTSSVAGGGEAEILRMALDGDLSPARVYAACGGVHDHLAVNVAVWVHEITEAMKRHRTVWVSSRLTKNGYMIKDNRGLRLLIKEKRLVVSGPRLAFAWAVAQLPPSPPDPRIDDADVPPSEDLSCARGDLAAMVDAFVDRRKVCNTMLRDKDWVPENPFVLSPDRTERVPRYRIGAWQKLAESEGALFVGDTMGCVVTLLMCQPFPRPVKVYPHLVRQDMLVVGSEGATMPCVAAQTQLRSVRIETYADLLKIPPGTQFPAVYAVEELSTHPGWIREAARFGPLVLLKVHSSS